MDNCLIQHRLDMTQQITNRLQHELLGVERLYNLFVSSINERIIVRNEIILVNDNFYLNYENILCPNKPPTQPFPLLEQNNFYLIMINDLELITIQLSKLFPDRHISLIHFSNWLMNYVKYFPQIK